jgi:hypothetical protein
MTGGAISAELRRYVIRLRRLIEIRLMALPAIGVCEVVVSANVTRLARLRYVRSLESESRGRMIKRRRVPGRGCMAGHAVMGELRRCMIRLQRLIEICLMALPAISIRQIVVATDVTGFAGLRTMRSIQRKSGGRVVKGRRLPRGCRMACLTLM